MTEKDTTALEALLDAERELYAQLTEVESAHAEARRAVQEELEELELEKFRDDSRGLTVSMVRPKPTQKLVKALLVQAGVTPDQLMKGTQEVKRSPFVSIRRSEAAG